MSSPDRPHGGRRRRRTPLLAFPVVTAFSAPVWGLEFYPPVPYELSGTDPTDVAVADFNGDGIEDLALAMAGVSGGDGKVSLLYGDGIGGFADHPFAVNFRPWGIAAGDLNQDGTPDLAVTEGRSESDRVRLYLADGGNFSAAPAATSGGRFPVAVASADVDEDGIADLLVANAFSPAVSLLRGTGRGGFASPENVTDAGTFLGSDIAVADLNGDGHKDFVLPQAVFVGTGTGGFSLVRPLGGHIAVSVGEFDGDRWPELAVLDTDTLKVWSGEVGADGYDVGFAWDQTFDGELRALTSGDLNSDGLADLALSMQSPDQLLLLQGRGDGSFSVLAPIAVGPEPGPVAIADWNEDGYPDLAVACRNRGETPFVQLLLQKPAGSTAGGYLRFSRTAYTVSEAVSKATLSVIRVNGTAGEVAADWSTVEGTATGDVDFQAASGRVSLGPGETVAEITITIMDDSIPEPDETFYVRLGATTSTLQIEDNDTPHSAGDAPSASNSPAQGDGNSGTSSGGGGAATFLLLAMLTSGLRHLFTRRR